MQEIAIKKIIEENLAQFMDEKISSIRLSAAPGGSINDSYEVFINENQKFFCKINSAKKFISLFEKEKNGIHLLARQQVICTPVIIACAESGGIQMLLLEWIEQESKTEKFWETFAVQLAALHKISWSDSKGHAVYGLEEDNYMGALIQLNTPSKKWTDFFMEQRLEPQLKLAQDNYLLDRKSMILFSGLYKKLPAIFSEEPSSLLHGDLWSGNFLCGAKGKPVLIDPAVYYGDRNVDLAMTTLFGGFDKKFYQAYDYYFPFSANYEEQWAICNLYPLLVHLNLFGQGYLPAILNILKRF
jgi:protein-ribulosamine 3-kinase